MLRYLAELYRFRDLLFWLAAKELKVRYKVPWLGFLWAVIVPVALSAIFWVVFTHVIPVAMGPTPFFLFLLAGMFPWHFFAQSVGGGTMSVLDAGALVRKTVFPRAVIPLAVVAAHAVNFLLALGVVLVWLVAAGRPLSPWLWLLPVAAAVHVVLTAGVTLLTAGLQVRYRDVKYLVELGLLAAFYLTPIFYPLEFLTRVSPLLRALALANPLAHLVELFRLAYLGRVPEALAVPPAAAAGAALAASAVLFFAGLAVFRRREATFADWVTG
jgi:ABC-type polysaccharide/polyol phosphate export permease